jgi:putative chitinase
MLTLTPAILLKITPNIGGIERAVTITNLINTVCPAYKIDSDGILHEFLAETAFESNEFKSKTESLFYSSGDRIFKTFPTHFASESEAEGFTKNAIKLANRVYSNRMGNGDEASGDGFTFRGGGFIQLTGKNIYSQYATYIKKDLDETTQLVRTTDQYALDSACWFFSVAKNLIPLAENDQFKELTLRINGGYNGLDGRTEYYNRAKQYLIA